MWHRLRDDPDFQPEWLRFMGQTPPTERADAFRSWGDGVGDSRPHVIEDLSFFGGWVECRCGSRVETTFGTTALESLWDIHRGLDPQKVAERYLMRHDVATATDDEVGSFLAQAANPGYSYEADE